MTTRENFSARRRNENNLHVRDLLNMRGINIKESSYVCTWRGRGIDNEFDNRIQPAAKMCEERKKSKQCQGTRNLKTKRAGNKYALNEWVAIKDNVRECVWAFYTERERHLYILDHLLIITHGLLRILRNLHLYRALTAANFLSSYCIVIHSKLTSNLIRIFPRYLKYVKFT